MGEDGLPEWMTHGITVLSQKDPQKGNTADNYQPITCLLLMWKLLTGVIPEEMFYKNVKFFQKNKLDAKEEVLEQRISY